VPAEAAPLLVASLHGVIRGAHRWLAALGLGGAIYSASGGVAALSAALNRAYGVVETRSWVKRKAAAIAITVVGALLLVLVSAGFVVGPSVASALFGRLGLRHEVDVAWGLLRWPAIVAMLTVLLALLYFACPSQRPRFRLITPGSLAAVPAWLAVTGAFNFYVTHLGTLNRTYGALAGGVVLLLWIQLSALVVILGGELNALMAPR
jgi:membrane protein